MSHSGGAAVATPAGPASVMLRARPRAPASTGSRRAGRLLPWGWVVIGGSSLNGAMGGIDLAVGHSKSSCDAASRTGVRRREEAAGATVDVCGTADAQPVAQADVVRRRPDSDLDVTGLDQPLHLEGPGKRAG